MFLVAQELLSVNSGHILQFVGLPNVHEGVSNGLDLTNMDLRFRPGVKIGLMGSFDLVIAVISVAKRRETETQLHQTCIYNAANRHYSTQFSGVIINKLFYLTCNLKYFEFDVKSTDKHNGTIYLAQLFPFGYM